MSRILRCTPPAPQHSNSHEPPDHRRVGARQDLFLNSDFSPGSPIFLPHGARVFNRLVDFVRRQHVYHGFDEVVTPNIYKTSLWERSGHLENFAEDMYAVTPGVIASPTTKSTVPPTPASPQPPDPDVQDPSADSTHLALKPMNCPGHCLVFASRPRSYRDLPLRFADFGTLHRNEPAGSLTGLTRVRRFHQDDGHIFCRPSQVESEIRATLSLIRAAYRALQLDFSLVLSTRPADGRFLGSPAEWDRAEAALARALDGAGGGRSWTLNPGDGAFYGPKIDVVVSGRDGRSHQTATVQLDFQLPRRFGLAYTAPAPELEARGDEAGADPALLAAHGPVTPVMIHRAVLGSVERMMALLIEEHDGGWPFWLNPRQVAVLTTNTSTPVLAWARDVRDVLVGCGRPDPATAAEPTLCGRPTGLAVEVDDRAVPLGNKVKEARKNGVGAMVVVGDGEVSTGTVMWERQSYKPVDVLARMQDMVESYM